MLPSRQVLRAQAREAAKPKNDRRTSWERGLDAPQPDPPGRLKVSSKLIARLARKDRRGRLRRSLEE